MEDTDDNLCRRLFVNDGSDAEDDIERLSNVQVDCIPVYLRIRAIGSKSRSLEILDSERVATTTRRQDKHFTFNHVFDEAATQEEVFKTVAVPTVDGFLQGENVLLFAYGATGAGKTYTMLGTPGEPGIIPRTLDRIFSTLGDRVAAREATMFEFAPEQFCDVRRIDADERNRLLSKTESLLSSSHNSDLPEYHTFNLGDISSTSSTASLCSSCTVWISLYEIYNDIVYDLLVPIKKRKALSVMQDREQRTFVKGLSEFPVRSAEGAYKLLRMGRANLQTAQTRLNQASSRSHMIFNVRLVATNDQQCSVNQLTLCDLAGSERQEKAGTKGVQVTEAGRINNSLMVLGRCIEALRRKDGAIAPPFRDSKLTRILQTFFVSTGRIRLVVNVNPSLSLAEETFHALRFSALASEVVPVPSAAECIRKIRRLTQAWNNRMAAAVPSRDDDDGDDDACFAQYVTLKESFVRKTLPSLVNGYDDLEEENEQLKKELSELIAMTEDYVAQVEKEKEDIRKECSASAVEARCQLRMELLKEHQEELQKQREAHFAELDKMMSEMKDKWYKEVDELDEELERTKAELDQLKQQSQKENSDDQKKKKKLSEVKVEDEEEPVVKKPRMSLMDSHLQRDIDALKEEITQLRTQYDQKVGELKSVEAERDEFKVRLEDVTRQFDELRGKYETLNSDYEDISRAFVETKGKNADLCVQLEDLKNRPDFESQLSTKEQLIAELQEEIEHSHKLVESQESIRQQLEENFRNTRSAFEASRNEVMELKNKIGDLEDNHAVAIQQCMERLDEQKKKNDGLKNELEREVKEKEKIIAEVEKLEKQLASVGESLENEVKEKEEALAEVKKLEKQIKEYKETMENVEDIRSEIERLQVDLAAAQSNVEEKTAELAKSESLVQELESEVAKMTGTLSENKEQIEALQSQLATTKKDLNAKNKEINNLQQRVTELLGELQEQTDRCSALAADFDATKTSVNDMAESLARKEKKIVHLMEELENARIAAKRSRSLGDLVADKQAVIDRLQEDVTRLEAQVSELQGVCDTLNIKLREAEKEKTTRISKRESEKSPPQRRPARSLRENQEKLEAVENNEGTFKTPRAVKRATRRRSKSSSDSPNSSSSSSSKENVAMGPPPSPAPEKMDNPCDISLLPMGRISTRKPRLLRTPDDLIDLTSPQRVTSRSTKRRTNDETPEDTGIKSTPTEFVRRLRSRR